MSDQQERFPRVNAMAREDGWGIVTDAALGILPENVESQARCVAKWAADRIEELEAENARLRVSATERERKAVLRGIEQEVRAETAEAKLATARNALEDIARQKRTDELETEYDVEVADFEGGYDAIIDVARAAIRALKSTSQT